MKSTKIVPASCAIDLVVVPKPKRAEIISALVEVARKEHAAKVAALDAQKKVARAEFKLALIKQLKRQRAMFALLDVETRHRGAELTLDEEHFDQAVATAHATDRATQGTYLVRFDEGNVRREIIRKLDGAEAPSERVAKLAGSEAIAALWKHINPDKP